MTVATRPRIPAYAPPASPFPVDLRLDANEGRPPTRQMLQNAATGVMTDVNLYPSTAPLHAMLAARLDVSPDRVVVTGGGDDALDRVCRAFVAPGSRAVMTSPTFEMIPRAARACGAEVREIPWWRGPFPTRQIIGEIDERTSLVVMVSPNNPTGAAACVDDLRAISRAAPAAVVCVDLAYTEYADVDLTAEALALPNTVIVRTLSKAWGLAGLRIGYAAGSATLVHAVRSAGGPYPVSAPALTIARQWLTEGESFMRASVDRVRIERRLLATLLNGSAVEVLDSEANFVMARFNNAWDVADRLAERHGIGVRRFPRQTTLSDYLRITCPCDSSTFERLARALTDVLDASEGTRT